MLIGEYKHTIDDKKRVSLPVRFRKELGKRIVVTHGLDNCLFLYPVRNWLKLAEKLAMLAMGKAETRGFNRFMLAGAVEVEIDSIGRILIPDFLKEFAGLRETVVVAGVHDRVEIWDEKRWGEYKRRIQKDADLLAQKLGELGVV